MSDSEIWTMLANLFFLDTDSTEEDFERVVQILNSHHWSRRMTEQTLVELIAPNVGANLGYLIFPIFGGVWDGFDQEFISSKVLRSKASRSRHTKWYFAISDWWFRRMLNELGMERLLSKLD